MEDKIFQIFLGVIIGNVLIFCCLIIMNFDVSVEDSAKADAYKALWIREHNLNAVCRAVKREEKESVT